MLNQTNRDEFTNDVLRWIADKLSNHQAQTAPRAIDKAVETKVFCKIIFFTLLWPGS